MCIDPNDPPPHSIGRRETGGGPGDRDHQRSRYVPEENGAPPPGDLLRPIRIANELTGGEAEGGREGGKSEGEGEGGKEEVRSEMIET